MSTTYDYSFAYYVKGNYLYLFELNESMEYVPPTVDITDGLKIEYTSAENAFVDSSGNVVTSPDEDSYINISDVYKEALIYYVKAKLAEDTDIKLKEYYEREFNTKFAQAKHAQNPSPRQSIPVYPYAIR